MQPLPVARNLLEIAHVAHRLSASEEYVRRLCRGRKIAAIRLGKRWRVDERDLDAFIERQRVASDDPPPDGPRLPRRLT